MVSIIIAVYNGMDFIKETVESALAQTVEKEVIIIDDCSTDESFNVLQQLKKNYSSINLIKNEKNIGFCKSVNIGVRNAMGDYILILGQDDILLPKHCEIMLKSFSVTTSMVFCDYYLIDSTGYEFDDSNHCVHENKTIKDLYKKNTIPSVGLIMSKEKLVKAGGYPENKDFLQYGEYHTWIRMAQLGEIIFCDDIRAKYRRHNNNMTNDFDNKKTVIRLNKYFRNCKEQILKSNQVGTLDKCYVRLYMCFYTLKAYLLGR